MPVRGLLIDRMSKKLITCLSLTYFVALAVLVIGASLAPNLRKASELAVASVTVPNERADVDFKAVTLGGLTPLNQFLVIRGRMSRPLLAASRRPVLANQDLSFFLTYRFSVAHAALTLDNATHSARVTCPKGAPDCSLGMLAYLPAVNFDSLSLDLNLEAPLVPFLDALGVPSAQLVPQVNASLTAICVDEAYTRFEIGWRYTGVVVSLVVFVAYAALLGCGPGVRDAATGARVATTFEQRYVLALALLCIFLDRPGFASEVVAPTLAAYAFGAVMQTTAVAALMFFFLVNFHLLALQSEAGASGVQWDVEAYEGGGGRRSVVGPCFYLPKVLIVTLAWVLALSTLLYSRYMQLTDPAFSLAEAYPDFWVYLTQFTYVIGAAYVALLLFYIGLGLRKCRSMPRSGVFFTTITLTTLVLLVAGVFANSFTNSLAFGGYFVVAYGVANMCVAGGGRGH